MQWKIYLFIYMKCVTILEIHFSLRFIVMMNIFRLTLTYIWQQFYYVKIISVLILKYFESHFAYLQNHNIGPRSR
jgi:hypothetical protein